MNEWYIALTQSSGYHMGAGGGGVICSVSSHRGCNVCMIPVARNSTTYYQKDTAVAFQDADARLGPAL